MNTTLHVPINKEIKEKAEEKVKNQGYSSLQEVIRVLIFSLAKGEVTTGFIHTNTVHHITPAQEEYLDRREKDTRNAIKHGNAHAIKTVEEMMDLLEDESHNHE